MATTDPITPHRVSIRPPRPLLIGIATGALVVAAVGGMLYRVDEHSRENRNRSFYDDFGRVKAGQQKSLYVYDTQGADRLLKQLRGMPQIEEIALDLTDASDNGMQHIAELPNLRKLVIYGGYPGIGDRGFICFRKCKTLQSVKLGAIPFRRRVAAFVLKERTRLRRHDRSDRISCEIGSCPRMVHFAGRRWSWETITWMDRIRRAFDHRRKWLVGSRLN